MALACGVGTAFALGAGALSAATPRADKAAHQANTVATADAVRVTYHPQKVAEVEVFYRQAGRRDAPGLLLLHGVPSASHMSRDLMPLPASQYRLIAPDLPGFGNTKAPPRGRFDYSFDKLYKVIEGVTEALGLTRYSLYVFDYGAPAGLRLAAAIRSG